MEAIKTVGLTKAFGKVLAVDHLDLTVEQGELFALLGVNGAGKTTTVRMLSCLTAPTAGDAYLEGHSVIADAKAVKSLIGVSPQETAVASNLTVLENLRMICGVHGLTKEKSRERIERITKELGLEKHLSTRASRLSGGWKRRVSIAMAMLSEPRILFLDEPTLGLDVIARSELWDMLRALKGKVTVVLTTHYMEEAEALSDRIAIMRDGRLLTVGTAEEIKRATGKDRFEDAFIAVVKEVRV